MRKILTAGTALMLFMGIGMNIGMGIDTAFAAPSMKEFPVPSGSRPHDVAPAPDGGLYVGTSPDGIDQAIRNGIERAGQTLRHIDWFEVTQIRGQAKDGAV